MTSLRDACRGLPILLLACFAFVCSTMMSGCKAAVGPAERANRDNFVNTLRSGTWLVIATWVIGSEYPAVVATYNGQDNSMCWLSGSLHGMFARRSGAQLYVSRMLQEQGEAAESEDSTAFFLIAALLESLWPDELPGMLADVSESETRQGKTSRYKVIHKIRANLEIEVHDVDARGVLSYEATSAGYRAPRMAGNEKSPSTNRDNESAGVSWGKVTLIPISSELLEFFRGSGVADIDWVKLE